MPKLISFGIPCYNSAEYMGHCIESILEGTNYSDEVEIIVVDDGSTKDNTLEIARSYAEKYPHIVRAHHQENGGHGIAVMCAASLAQGIYFKNIDSDDWVDAKAVAALLDQIRHFVETNSLPDMIITNYVYEHVEDGTQRRVSYASQMPENKVFSWDDMGHFGVSQYLLMHAITYRTEVLIAAHVEMPAHTFYVDNIYAYVPFPLVKTLYYMDLDLYRYFIGREDQSVNDTVLTSRVDHYWRVARYMMHAYHIEQDISSPRLQEYMSSYFTMMMAICSVFSKKSDRADAKDELAKLWSELKAYDEYMYKKARHGLIGTAANLPGAVGEFITLKGYKVAQKLFKFN